VRVDPQFANPGRVAGPVSRGQQDQARGGQLGPFSDHGGHGQVVPVRHAGVEQHQRKWPALGGAMPQGVYGGRCIAYRLRLHLPISQPLLEDVAVGGVVIDDEDR
jgi:hypothetical protein